MIKKYLTLFISICLVITLLFSMSGLSVYAFDNDNSFTVKSVIQEKHTTAEIKKSTISGECGESMSWGYDTETATLTISGTGEMTSCTGMYYDGTSFVTINAPWYDYRNEIEKVIVEEGVTNIAAGAFMNCTNLKSVTVSDSVTNIGAGAFMNTKWFLNQPDGLIYVGKVLYTYKGTCPENVVVKDGTLRIENGAFMGCKELKTIVLPGSVISIGSSVFSSCTALKSIAFTSESSSYRSSGNCLIETKSKTLIAGCKNSIIPDDGSVTSIDSYSFYGCTGLTSIIIPVSVTSIGKYAFESCTSLTSVNIADSVTNIDVRAFFNCASLESITIPGSVKTIGSNTFGCCESLTNITVLVGVTNIDYSAFSFCTALESITIPYSVTSIGEQVFSGCTNLKTVYFKGTEEEWGNIAVGNYGNEYLLGAELVLVEFANGDLNRDENITDQDAIYLLFSYYFPDKYPVSQPCDFNKDGFVTDQDAIYLLFHYYFPKEYPIE